MSLFQRGLPVALLLAVVGVGAAIGWKSLQPGRSVLWRQAQAAAERKEWELALALAERALRSGPPKTLDWTRAGSWALKAGRLPRATELFSRVDDHQFGAAEAHRQAGSAWLAIGHVVPAEQAFRHALEIDAANLEARLALAELLRLSGRYFELEPHVRSLIDAGQCPSALLFAMAWPDKVWLDDADREQITRFLQTDPDAAWIGLAADSADALTPESRLKALQRARSIALTDPRFVEAFARWGTLLVDSDDWDSFPEWNRHLSAEAQEHPQVWYVRGLWQLRDNDSSAAIRCFWEALERSPFHAGATYQISLLLPRVGDSDIAERYALQAKHLAELRQQVVFGKGAGGFPDPDVLQRIVQLLNELGRRREAIGWCELAIARHPELPWPRNQIEAMRKTVTADSTWIADDDRLSRRIRLDHFPLPDWSAIGSRQLEIDNPQSASSISFNNVAAERGLNFQFTNGSHIDQPNGYMYEVSGGGIGILDYDLDGWPDLFLTDGGPELSLGRDPEKMDRLFRNQFGERVADVTAAARIFEIGYGQGVAVGDINSDGFPDLFVANIGRNQLWINQGDGTLGDGTELAALSGSVWTISAVLADLDGDGLADAYEVNYLGGDATNRICSRDGIPIQCRPTLFPPEPNRLWRNERDGRFADVTASIAAQPSTGKGMGVVTADFEQQCRLALFVSNDSEPNSFLRNEAPARGQTPEFVECAISCGLAFGVDGSPLASMGIAVDDVDQDGRLDLYVTNFLSEGSNLYLQDAEGAFTDRARSYGIYGHSLPKMGWGAQFLDADLDGWPDLIVANGHLEDYRRWDIESPMVAQFFRNRHGRQFDALTPEKLGPYFAERHFGRSVARFDGNRDGLEDVLVTHVDAPVAWLQNQTRGAGHFLAVRLIGIASERDAIGARLTASFADRTLYKQVTAGDGFQASNQRRIIFGMEGATQVEVLTVNWPSGMTQRFRHVPADREIIVREGLSDWIELQDPRPRAAPNADKGRKRAK